jgi:hypothetical protein
MVKDLVSKTGIAYTPDIDLLSHINSALFEVEDTAGTDHS